MHTPLYALLRKYTQKKESVTNLRWNIFGGFNPNCGVPFTRRQDSHLIKELIYPWEEVCPVFGLISHIMENLYKEELWEFYVFSKWSFAHSKAKYLPNMHLIHVLIYVHIWLCYAVLDPSFTSSVISVAIDLPISWYWGPFPRGPKSRKRNLGTRKIHTEQYWPQCWTVFT